jgi:hypothetical protein
LGFSNWPVIYYKPTSFLAPSNAIKFSGFIITVPPSSFSGAIAGEEVEDLCKGIFSHTHHLLCFKFCFTLFLLASFYTKNPKKKLESLVVVIPLLLVHHAVP